MTILIDHLNLDKEEDPGYWYLYALDFKSTFCYLFTGEEKLLKRKKINLDKLPPQAGTISMWTIYFTAIELYLKTFLLKEGGFTPWRFMRKEYGHHLERLLEECQNIESLKNKRDFQNEDLIWIIQTLYRRIGTDDWTKIRYPKNSIGMFGRKTMIPPLIFLDRIVKPLVWVED